MQIEKRPCESRYVVRVSIHVAILRRPYPELILSGEKTVESRLYQTRQPPVGCVQPGERLFIKVSGGAWAATAIAAAVDEHTHLTRTQMQALRERYQPTVLGTDEYWKSKLGSRYAVFITLRDVERFDTGPAYPSNGYRAWHVLDERLSPLREVTLTAGAIRNRYATMPFASPRLRQEPFTLVLPDDERVETRLYEGGTRIAWRGWGKVFEGASAGDVLRFVRVGEREFAVSVRRST